MISVKDQQSLLLSVSKELNKKITVFAVGGTAMMFLGYKDVTLDIDLVFLSEDDRMEFKEAAKRINYKEVNPVRVYGVKDNLPVMLTLGDERFDLFVNKVVSFYFSEQMQKRAGDTYEFDQNLILKVADPHDLILMKCATDRAKDKDDALNIIKNTKIKWDLIIDESLNQKKLGVNRSVFELGCFLDELKKLDAKIPQEVLDKLYDLIEDQRSK